MHELLLEKLEEVLEKKASWVNVPMPERNGEVPRMPVLELYKLLREKQAEKNWFASFLATMCRYGTPGITIFDKAAPLKSVKKNAEEETKNPLDIDNSDSFFTDLAHRVDSREAGRRRKYHTSEADRVAADVARLEARIAKAKL